jgi:hypothetical protein
MLYFPRLLSLLLHIDQETVLKWFGLEDPNSLDVYQLTEYGYDIKCFK